MNVVDEELPVQCNDDAGHIDRAPTAVAGAVCMNDHVTNFVIARLFYEIASVFFPGRAIEEVGSGHDVIVPRVLPS
jgi:hypothetical protein